MIDWHTHILPGLDDGAPGVEEALAMARLLEAAGFQTVYCTPHCLRGMYETDPEQVRESVSLLQQQLIDAGIGLRLVPGMEYCLDEFLPERMDALLPLGDSRRVLVETPSNADPQLLKEDIFRLVRGGYEPLLAHPERHAFLAPPGSGSGRLRGPARRWFARGEDGFSTGIEGTLVDDLRLMGCRFQGNLGSFAGYYGSLVRKQAERFLAHGLYDCFGSDAHASAPLEQYLAPGLEKIADEMPSE